MSGNQPPFFFRSRKHLWGLIAILLIASVLAVAIPLALLRTNSQGTAAPADTGPQNFSVGPNAWLTIKEYSGNISIYPSNTNLITITPRKSGTTLAPDPHSVHILYTSTLNAQGNDQISVTTNPWFSTIDFYITIPSTTLVQTTTSSGSIDVHGGHGLTASTGSGSIALENIQGTTNVHTDSGDIIASDITGSLTISASSGSLKMQQVHGQVNAKTRSGDVTATDSALSGNSSLQTQNGSIRFDGSLDPNGTYKMQTTSGDVDLTLPGNTAFTLDASTGSGTIQNAFGDSTIGLTPRAQLSLRTQNGSIAIVKAV